MIMKRTDLEILTDEYVFSSHELETLVKVACLSTINCLSKIKLVLLELTLGNCMNNVLYT